MRVFGLFLFLLSFCLTSSGQTYRIKGRIVDEQGEGLVGATVYLHETLQGTSSNDSGYFILGGLNKGIYHLHVTYVGYHAYSQNVRVGDSTQDLLIELHPSDLELHEAIIEDNALKLEQGDYTISVQVIDSKSLERNQGPTLSNALEQIPGINSINMGVAVSKPVIRGMSGNRIVVAENGIKQEGQQWGADHGLEIDPFNAERIEIIKGPASLLYGSDAMGGVIHIKQPLIPLTGTHEGKFKGIYKSVNSTFGGTASASGNSSGWVYRLRATWLEYGDYHVPADSFTYNRYTLPIQDGTLKNTAGKEQHLAGQIGLHRKWGYSRISISNYNQNIGVFSGAIGIPRAYNLVDDGNSRNIELPNQRINHLKIISNSNIQFGGNWLEIDAGFQQNLRKELSSPHAHGQPVGTSSLAHELNLSTASLNARYYRDKKTGTSTLGFSGIYQQHRFGGYEFLLTNFERAGAGLFIFQNRHINPLLTVSGGLRIDYGWTHIHAHNQTNYNNGVAVGESERVAENTREFLNWSGAIGLSKYFNHALNLKLNLGKSFRIPTTQELSVNGVHHGSFRHEKGDATLNPEQAIQFDAGLNYESKSWFIAVSPFLNYFQNYIYLRPTAQFSPLPEAGQIFQYTQAEALMSGGELSIEYHPIKALHLETGLEYVYAQNLKEKLPLPFIPPFQVKSAVEWEGNWRAFKDAYVRLAWNWANAQERTDRNERTTPGYNLVNFGCGTSYQVTKNYALSFSLNVRNVFNVAYYNHLSRWRYLNLPEPGRNVNLQLTVPLW